MAKRRITLEKALDFELALLAAVQVAKEGIAEGRDPDPLMRADNLRVVAETLCEKTEAIAQEILTYV